MTVKVNGDVGMLMLPRTEPYRLTIACDGPTILETSGPMTDRHGNPIWLYEVREIAVDGTERVLERREQSRFELQDLARTLERK